MSNHLIELLPRADRKRLLAICEPLSMVLSEVLQQPDTPTAHVYFPTSGFVSLIALVDAASGVEVGMVGPEGMVGAYLALGVNTHAGQVVYGPVAEAHGMAVLPLAEVLS